MKNEPWKERWHDLKERVMHPFGGHHEESLGESAEELKGKASEEAEKKTDESTGSEFRD